MTTLSFHSKDLAQFAKPNVIETLSYEALLSERIAQLNALQPLLFDGSAHQPTLKSAEMIVTDTESYWKVPVDEEAGLLYLDLESEPLLRLLQADVYREMAYRNRINQAALAIMPAYATGNDLDNLALRDKVYRLDGESDARFRRRWLLSAEGQSTGGSEGWYVYHALTSDSRVKDIRVFSPTPRGVTVVVLSTEGNGEASSGLLTAVSDYLTEQYTGVMTDEITVISAEIIEYSVNATAHFYTGASTDLVIEQMTSAFNAYRWGSDDDDSSGSERIGHWVDESGILSALHQSGVYRVVLNDDLVLPIEVSEYQAPYCTGLVVTEGEEHGIL